VQPKRLAQNLTSNYWDYLNWAYSLTKFTWLIYYKIGHQEKKNIPTIVPPIVPKNLPAR
jgi:hypothetical protein